ncbi:MAG: HAD family hydrolase [Magnetococcales bacterium]|nr:HAD family hydrolase [Magnetococcales bacterium]
MWDIFAELDQDGSINAYQLAANRLREASGGLQPVRMRLLASFVVQPFLPTLTVEAARLGFALHCDTGPFNVIIPELLQSDSPSVTGDYDALFILRQLRDTCPELAMHFLTLSPEEVASRIDATVRELETALEQFRARCASRVIVHNFVQPAHPELGILEGMAGQTQSRAIRHLNHLLGQRLTRIPGVYVLDFDRVCAQVGYDRWQDDKLRYLARAPLSAQVMPELARTQATFLHALLGRVRKCLVLDLDNTLWGGVIGEEGMARIALGHAGLGWVYREFQEEILKFHQRGILLAIASKNNPQDALAVLRDHPDMVLREHHFAAMRINWEPKPDNLAAMALELNLGTDALVFLDDSPQEREQMRRLRPEILTPELPRDPMGYAGVLRRLGVFDKLSLTREDLKRGEMYRQQTERTRLQESAGSMEEYYRGLVMRVTVTPVDRQSFPRALDLLHKTNQFNLTTRRHDESTLQALLDHPDAGVFVLRVVDKFGDNGLVGVAILELKGDGVAELDSFLLSCRVIGRTVETAFLAHLADWAVSRGVTRLLAEFLPTAKNQPAAGFLPGHGFHRIDATPRGSRWSLDLTRTALHWPDYIERGSP